MKLTEQMVVAGLRFRDTALWETLDDGMLYAVRQPDGSIAYYCVMGNGGTHFSLACYRGDDGFSTFLKVIYGGQVDSKRAFEIAQSYNFISCDFVNASKSLLTKAEKTFIRKTAEKNDLKIRRSHGWPEFITINNGKYLAELDNEKDITAIILGLQAGVAISHRLNHPPKGVGRFSYAGFDVDADYPPLEGGQEIPLLLPQADGTFEWSHTLTPAFNPKKIKPVEFSDSKMLESLKKLPHKGGYQAKIIHMPSPIGNSRSHYFPLVLLMAAIPSGFLIPVLGDSDAKDQYGSIVSKLAETFMQNKVVPAFIQIDDERTDLLLRKLCEDVGIKLEVEPFMEFVEEGWDFLFNMSP